MPARRPDDDDGNNQHFCIQKHRLERIDESDKKILARLEAQEERNKKRDEHDAVVLDRLSQSDVREGKMLAALGSISERIGRPPDPSIDDEGSGISRVVYRTANRINEHDQQINQLFARVDSVEDMSEVTRSQTWEQVAARAKRAEAKLARAESALADQHASAQNADVARETSRATTRRTVITVGGGIVVALLTGGGGLALIQYLLG